MTAYVNVFSSAVLLGSAGARVTFHVIVVLSALRTPPSLMLPGFTVTYGGRMSTTSALVIATSPVLNTLTDS